MNLCQWSERLLGRALSLLPSPWVRLLARLRSPSTCRATQGKQLLVDVSATFRQDVRTGIQRVVRAWLTELQAHPPHGFQVRPVFATFQRSYCYVPDTLTKDRPESQPAEAVQVGPGDVFLGIDLSAHLLPRWQWQLLKWKRSGVRIDVVVHDLLPLQHPEWFNPKTARNFRRWALVLAKYVDTC